MTTKTTIINNLKQNAFTMAAIIWALFITYVVILCHGVKVEEEPTIIYETVTEYIEVDTGLIPYYQKIADEMTVEEYHLLAAIVDLEAGNQSATGQRAVVEVVFNRVLDPRFPNTVKGVLSQADPVQFSTWKNRANAQPTQEQYDAIDATLLTTEPILLPEVLYFASVDMNRTRYERIGNHNFYIG